MNAGIATKNHSLSSILESAGLFKLYRKTLIKMVIPYLKNYLLHSMKNKNECEFVYLINVINIIAFS